MRVDTAAYPAEDIVLLDDIGQERKRRRGFENLAVVDHKDACALASGTQRRQAVISFLVGSEGSSRAYPCVKRERHLSASFLSRSLVSARNPRRLNMTPFSNCSA